MGFELRKMQMEDKKRVLDMVKGLWDGDDYMPQVFDTWVADQRGEFTAALYDGVIVGCSKLTFLADGHAWLEGLRSDLDFKVRGMGKALTSRHLDILRDVPGLKSVRFATYIENHGSIITAQRLGFKEVFRLSVKSKEFGTGEKSSTASDIKTTADKETILKETENMPFYHQIGDNFLSGWRVYPMDRKTYARFVESEELSLMKSGGSSILFNTSGSEMNIMMMNIRCMEDGARIMEGLEEHALKQGIVYSEVMVPNDKLLKQLLERYGYVSWLQEDDFIVYEYPLSMLRETRFE